MNREDCETCNYFISSITRGGGGCSKHNDYLIDIEDCKDIPRIKDGFYE